MPVNTNHLDRPIHVLGPQVTNGPGHVEYELADSHRSRQGLGGDQNLTGKQTLQDTAAEVRFTQAADITQNGLPFWLSLLHHHQRDSASVGPVAALSQKNSSEFGPREFIYRIRLV